MAKSTVIGSKIKRVETKELRAEGILAYDIDNLYPQRVKDSVAASVTGSGAVELFATHLFGRGFAKEDLNTLIINAKGQTLKDLHELACNDFAYFRGVSLHIGYNALLEVASIDIIPFDYVRLAIPDDLGVISHAVVYDDWDGQKYGGRRKKDLMKSLDFFTSDKEKIASQIEGAGGFGKWNGHIYYYSASGHRKYPTAKCDPCFEDLVTDAGVKVFAQRNIQTGFMANAIFIHKGKFQDDDARDEFVDNLKTFQGASNSNKMMLVEAETDDQKPEVLGLPVTNNDKLFENTEPNVMNRIIRTFGQPLILHAIKTAGSLGESTEWEDAVKNYDQRTEKEREKLGLIYQPIFENWFDGNPNKENNYLVVPISGIEEKAKRQVLSTTLGVGGMTSLREVVADPLMTKEQKVNYCILVFGMSKDDADSLINGTQINE